MSSSETRRCNSCDVPKALDEFPRHKDCKLGRGYTCKVCNSERACAWAKANRERVQKKQNAWRKANRDKERARWRAFYARNLESERARRRKRNERPEIKVKLRWDWIKRKYKMTKEQWLALFDAQNNRCGCCGRTDPASKRGWHTDHNHATGKVRGIVCHPCNVMIGAARDLAENLLAGVDYLERTQ